MPISHIKLLLFERCVGVFLCTQVCVCVCFCVHTYPQRPEGVSGPLGLDLLAVVSSMGAMNWTLVFCNSRKCSLLLSYLSIPNKLVFEMY